MYVAILSGEADWLVMDEFLKINSNSYILFCSIEIHKIRLEIEKTFPYLKKIEPEERLEWWVYKDKKDFLEGMNEVNRPTIEISFIPYLF